MRSVCEAAVGGADGGAEQLAHGGLPDLAVLRARFEPPPLALPLVTVDLPAIASYGVLLPTLGRAPGGAP